MKEPLEEEFETPTQYEAAWHKWKNMKTHIIIPIKDIEERIKKLSRDIEIFSGNEYNHDFIKGRIAELQEQMIRGKQISLDEKDIEKKANFHQYSMPSNFEDYTYENGVKFGYRQALIDILK